MSDEPGSERHPGLLALEQSVDGTVHGFVVSEALVTPNKENLRSAITIAPLSGSVTTTEDGATNLSFLVRDQFGGVLASNTVRLNAEGSSLSGETTQHFEGADRNRDVRSVQLNYRWMAGRIR
jgi:hypothetical protein